jgi:peptide/nickel transport system substrate-binding protein
MRKVSLWKMVALGLTVMAVPVFAATPDAAHGGTLRVCAWEELTNLNPYICCTLGWPTMVPAVLQRLISFDGDGNPFPVLAREVPTIANGGVADSGKTVTYRLRPGVKWADGEMFTSVHVRVHHETGESSE